MFSRWLRRVLLAVGFLVLSACLVASAAAAPAQPTTLPAGQAQPLATLPPPDLTLSPRFQTAQVAPGATLHYQFTLTNHTGATQQVTFQPGIDSGWTATANPASATVPAGGTTNVDLTVQVAGVGGPGSARVILSATAGAATATAGLALWTAAHSFADLTAKEWEYSFVQFLVAQGVISGYADDTFRAAAPVTRAQFAKMLVVGMRWSLVHPAHATFSDVPLTHWASPYVETGVAHGILTGYADGTFRPNANVTRAQLAKLLVLARGWRLLDPPSASFHDVATTDWDYQFVETAADVSAVGGYADGTFRPGANATRGQLAKILASGLLVGDNYRSQPIPTPVPPTATPPPSPTPSGPQIYWGAYIKGDTYGYNDPPWDWRTVDAFESHAGKAMSIVHWGEPWMSGGNYQIFDTAAFNITRQHGRIPMINWNSWDSCCGATQPAWTLSQIINGTYDSYIRQWATAAASWGHPFFLRFDDEMNGRWYPWAEQVNGNSPGQFVQMWRHVHDIFTQVGATNVTWVWTANSEYPGSTPLAELYPGDNYVDWVAFAGYNWGTNPVKPDEWVSFATRFGPSYDIFTQIAPTRPVMIAEIASTEYGGSKAAWITDALAVQLPVHYPRVKAFVWYNWDSEGEDWIIESSPSSQAAFAAAIASPNYALPTYGNLNISPIPPPGTWPVP